ncbi:MAG: deoxyguanosinetriphosphate triphosphohydrolase [Firmicutes bacterium]|nr:deoxyguanosinetriphosphate triphosphohydrolase [Bacillota bacterium]
MIYREKYEELEYERLSKYAAKSAETVGRLLEEEKCEVRTEYQRDRDRIIHSKALRRLMHKTQVFIAPEDDHYRTRLTHTLEVAQIAKTIARGLALNEDLTDAIAMGHDLGHTPFGHSGESCLNEIHPGGFRHNVQSLRVVEVLEKSPSGSPLNLTLEVRDGILNHTGPVKPITLEGQVVKISDRIAYINHDIDDALRGGIIKFEELPKGAIKVLGETHSKRINTLVTDMIENSEDNEEIIMSRERWDAMNELRSFMFKNVYRTPWRKDETEKINYMIRQLYDHFLSDPKELPKDMYSLIEEWGVNEAVKDYIASMTDRYALRMYEKVFMPRV